ncbi:MAG: hypothetical protein JSS02_14765 [Planctomycetes bacterium]|nr:hypothetical protein [Planctomycetota bacterium]
MRRLLSCSLLLSVGLLGCSAGGEGALPLYQATGSLKVGGKPLANITVQLTPVDATAKSKPGIGKTDAEGKFTIATNGDKGANPGKYKVVLIDGAAMAASNQSQGMGGKQISTEEASKMSGEMAMKIMQQGKAAMTVPEPPFPKEWGDAKTSPKEVEVTNAAITINIDI